MNKDDFFELCREAGFEPTSSGLSGNSEDDRQAYVEEYPCGESLLELAKLLGIEIKD
jgi:hypothetical protein